MDIKDLKNLFIGIATNQTIGGIKRFLRFPYTPDDIPTEDYQVVNKKYIDDIAISVSLPIGDTSTNGSWIAEVSGTSLKFYHREAGAWVERGSFTGV